MEFKMVKENFHFQMVTSTKELLKMVCLMVWDRQNSLMEKNILDNIKMIFPKFFLVDFGQIQIIAMFFDADICIATFGRCTNIAFIFIFDT